MARLAIRPDLWDKHPVAVQRVIGGKLGAVRKALQRLQATQVASQLVANGAWLDAL